MGNSNSRTPPRVSYTSYMKTRSIPQELYVQQRRKELANPHNLGPYNNRQIANKIRDEYNGHRRLS